MAKGAAALVISRSIHELVLPSARHLQMAQAVAQHYFPASGQSRVFSWSQRYVEGGHGYIWPQFGQARMMRMQDRGTSIMRPIEVLHQRTVEQASGFDMHTCSGILGGQIDRGMSLQRYASASARWGWPSATKVQVPATGIDCGISSPPLPTRPLTPPKGPLHRLSS